MAVGQKDPKTMPEYQVGQALMQRGFRLITAESCTGGLLGHRITNIPGSSEYYIGGIISYANEAKSGLLGVKKETLETFGAVSREAVLEMASGVRKVFAHQFDIETLIGVSVSGVAGPGGGTEQKPVGLVWIGLSAPDGDWSFRLENEGSREENKEYAARCAIQILMDYLTGHVPQDGR